MTLVSILTFLSANKAIIVGATATMGEVTITLVNLYRKYKAGKNNLSNLSYETVSNDRKIGKMLLWSINPINLFRDPA